MERHAKCDYLMKFALLGSSRVGKTSILYRYTRGEFPRDYAVTTGIDYLIRTIDLGSKKARLQVWDHAGAERFSPITKSCFRGVHGIIFVLDITDETSFHVIDDGLSILDESHRFAEKVLIGNKCDLTSERKVSEKEAEAYASSKGMRYYETSALDGTNIDYIFYILAIAIKEKADSGLLISKPSSYPLHQPTLRILEKACN
eukprot:TRINITY_DN11781_c0_g1_i2.p1 TRINITY_DN11781_c0_g1~~TRINITY_DN11781_c0_g1_i2.p1  ORF type:complete len:202 (-),score=23.43 TRINITY_DN11781_c0_g1_i2:93-698(-)